LAEIHAPPNSLKILTFGQDISSKKNDPQSLKNYLGALGTSRKPHMIQPTQLINPENLSSTDWLDTKQVSGTRKI